VGNGANLLKKVPKETAKMTDKQKQAYFDKFINAIAKEANKQKITVGKVKVVHNRLSDRIICDDSKVFNPES